MIEKWKFITLPEIIGKMVKGLVCVSFILISWSVAFTLHGGYQARSKDINFCCLPTSNNPSDIPPFYNSFQTVKGGLEYVVNMLIEHVSLVEGNAIGRKNDTSTCHT